MNAVTKARYIWYDRAYLLGKRRDAFIRWVVWRLPRSVVMWAYIRVGAHATTGRYGNTAVHELSMMEALKRWDTPNDGDPLPRGGVIPTASGANTDDPGPIQVGGALVTAGPVTLAWPADRVPLTDPAHWSESFPVAFDGRRAGPHPAAGHPSAA